MKYWEIIADNLSKAGWSWRSVPCAADPLTCVQLEGITGEATARD
jgi:hypothetical protein